MKAAAPSVEDRIQDFGGGLIVSIEALLDASFELAHLVFEFLVRGDGLAQLHEGTHDVDRDFGRSGGVETIAAMIAPCSVKASGRLRRPPRPVAFDGKRAIDCVLARSMDSCSRSSIAGYAASVIFQGSNAS